MPGRLDRFSLVTGVVIVAAAPFAATGSLGEIVNRGSLVAGLGLGAGALVFAASAITTKR